MDQEPNTLRRTALLVLLLLAVPVFGVCSGLWLMRGLEPAEAAAGAPPLAAICWRVPFQWMTTDLCGPYQHAAVLAIGSVAVAAFVVAATGLIALAGRWAQRNERLLVVVFAPAARFLVVSLALVILAQGAILAYAFFALFEQAVSIQLAVPVVIAWGAAAAAFGLLRNAITVFRLDPFQRRAVALTPQAQPALWQAVAGIAQALGAPLPGHVVAGLDDGFFVTAVPVVLPHDATVRGETLYLPLPLMRVLSIGEWRAVIGHELAHFKGRDTQWSVRFAPVFSGLQDVEERMGEHRGWGVLSLLPALFLLRFFLGQFVIAERMMQRRRELAADRLGAAVASPAELAAALTRLSSLHYVRRALRRAVQGRRLDAGQSHNLSAFFAYWAGDYFASNDAAKILKEIGAARLPHPVDTHPALRDRLAALGLEADAAWLAVPETSASALIAGVDAIEIRLSRDEAAFFSQVGNMPLRGR